MINKNEKYKSFKYLLDCYYHQDIWEDFSTHQDIWEDFIKHETKENSAELLSDFKKIFKEEISFVVDFINKINPHGLNLRSEKETKEWLENCIEYFQSNI